MSQDINRWKNQNFAVSVYDTRYQGGGFLVEAVHVDKPAERAYLRVPTLMGMRGEILKYYIDAMVRILGKDDTLQQAIMDAQTGFGADNVIERIEFSCTPEEFRARMSKDPNYANWEYEALREDEKPDGFQEEAKPSPEEEEAKFLEESKRRRLEQIKKGELQKRKAQEKKAKQAKMKNIVLRLQSFSEDLDVARSEAFRLWRRLVADFHRKRKERQEQERQERLELLGEDVASFLMSYRMTAKRSVDLQIQINKFSSPNYFKVTVTNTLNLERQDDTVMFKLYRLPGSLRPNERDAKKIRHAFAEKLSVVWEPQAQLRGDGIPRMQDAFIDNTVATEHIIQKVVEVKVWDEYHGKPEKKRSGSSDSQDSQLDADEAELTAIDNDVRTMKQLVRTLARKVKGLEQGLEKWFKHFDADGSGEIEINELVKMLKYLQLQLEDRLVIMLFRLFDRSNEGFFTYKDFVDILTKRMRPNYRRIVA